MALPAISSRFQLIRRVGAGGMGVVYEALDTERNTRVALKTLRDLDASSLLRFKTEFRSLQDLVHPNLITLHELFEENGQWFFTMELVAGVDFLAYTRPIPGTTGPREVDPDDETMIDWADAAKAPPSTQPPMRLTGKPSSDGRPRHAFDEQRLRASLAELTAGLVHLHAARKVHRDIKPSNVLVTREGRVVILDFGLVSESQRATEPTDNSIVGTAAYMAPEQAASKPVGPEADWYAVGVVLYEALTGRLPFDGTPITVLMHKQMREPDPPRALDASIPADLDALASELLRFDPLRRATGADVARRLGIEGIIRATSLSPSSLSTTVPFVGRGKELLQLEQSWEMVRSGKAVTVYVHGESGVGKSALVDRFIGALGDPDAQPTVVLRGRCYERESVPYKALDGVIDALSRALARMKTREVEPLLPARAALLAQVFPVLRRVEAFAHAPRDSFEALDPQELRARLFGALRELFQSLTTLVDLVVIIDDLQWADADSMALLREVMRVPSAPPMLLLLTLRGAPGGAVPISQLHIGGAMLPGEVRLVPLGRLSAAEALELAEKLVARSGSGAGTAESLAKEAQGHPLFIEELVRHAAIVGTGHAVSRLEDALWARVQMLPPAARAVLELLSVAGHPVGRDELDRASGIEDATEFERSVSALRAGRFVRASTLAGKKALEPFHDKIRSSVLAHVDAETKQSVHARLAVALEASPKPDPEALAEHWRGAGEADKAAQYAERAAQEALSAFAFDRAARLYRLVLVLRTPQEEELRDLRRKLGDALASAGRGAEAAEMYLEAALGASTSEALELRRRAATQLLLSGHVEEGLSAFRNVLKGLGLRFPETSKAAWRSRLVRRAWLKVRGLSFKARDASLVPDAERVRIDVCWSVGLGLGTVDPTRGSDFQTQGLLRALAAGDALRVGRALSLEAAYLAAMGQGGEAEVEDLLRRAEVLANEQRNAHAQGVVSLARAFAAYLWGRYGSILRDASRAEAIFRERCIGAQTELDIAVLLSMRALFFTGNIKELRAKLPVHLREAQERGNLYALYGLRTGHLIGAWLADDDVDGAMAQLDDATRDEAQHEDAELDLRGTHAFMSRANIALYRDAFGDESASLSDEGLPAQGRLLVQALKESPLSEIQQERVDLWWTEARLLVAMGAKRRKNREALLVEAEKLALRLKKEGMPLSIPASRMILAAVFAQRGRTSDAERLLAEAAELFDGGQMVAFGAIARRQAGVVANDAAGAAALVDEEAKLRALGYVAPARFANTYAPGFG
ncbi:MAG: AAA family ATPase [Myxococcales bacterium]|nr:AAA family ATPase [Myxococcales bacterium]